MEVFYETISGNLSFIVPCVVHVVEIKIASLNQVQLTQMVSRAVTLLDTSNTHSWKTWFV